MTGPEKKTDEARQGVTGTGTRYVFAISTAAALVALFAIAFVFFGAPDMGLDDARSGADATPPYELPEETPDWQEPAPVENPSSPSAP
ncbi:hypothetical protein [Parvibaculum sp.]|jgi:hypothetical protein|uniref:hypothetical protein n=1 Tax=Parvibaculum sp. TaxID=2024848 RepID=UPI002FD8A125